MLSVVKCFFFVAKNVIKKYILKRSLNNNVKGIRKYTKLKIANVKKNIKIKVICKENEVQKITRLYIIIMFV